MILSEDNITIFLQFVRQIIGHKSYINIHKKYYIINIVTSSTNNQEYIQISQSFVTIRYTMNISSQKKALYITTTNQINLLFYIPTVMYVTQHNKFSTISVVCLLWPFIIKGRYFTQNSVFTFFNTKSN